MKIIFVVPNLSSGGVERVVSRFSIEFEKLGYEVKIIMLTNKVEYNYGGELIILNSQPSSSYIVKLFNLLSRTTQLKKIFRQEKSDFIYAFMESCTYSSILTGEDIIVSIQNNMESRLNKYQKKIMSFFYNFKNVKKVIAVSKGIEESLHKNNILNTKRIYNPISFRNDFNTKEDLSKYQPYLLSAGRLDQIKNFEMLIKAYNNTKTKDETKLIIVGEGKERKNLEELIRELKLEDKVLLLGRKDNIDDYYYQSDMYILSSKSEGFPNVLMEALSNKCPVISTDCPTGPDEIIIHNKNGILVENENQDKMTKAIDDLYFDVDKKVLFRNNAIESISQLDGDKIAQQWLSI